MAWAQDSIFDNVLTTDHTLTIKPGVVFVSNIEDKKMRSGEASHKIHPDLVSFFNSRVAFALILKFKTRDIKTIRTMQLCLQMVALKGFGISGM